MSKDRFINRLAREEIGYNLWLLRRERNLNLQRLSLKINVPIHILDDIERGRHFEFCALYRLMNFYGKKLKITFE